MKYWAVLAGLLLAGALVHAQDYTFEIPDMQSNKSSLKLSGNIDLKYSIIKSRQSSLMYRLQNSNQPFQDSLSSYKINLYLNGDYQPGDTGIHFKTNTGYNSESQADAELYELYGNMNLSVNSFLILGKKMYSWGKGYAFNPVGYVNPVKDPENPELSQSGIFSAGYEYSRSFQAGPLQNASFDLIVIPSLETVDSKISEVEKTGIAGKLYFLLFNTDIDIMQYYSNINPVKTGADFSGNILTNLELHGEFSIARNQPKYIIANNALDSENIEASSYLAGVRWLNEWNITTILEYYHNDGGLTGNEFAGYNEYMANAVVSGNSNSISSAMNVSKSYFSGANIMQDYLYLKMSCPEPFNWIYFTPSFFIILNINDESSMAGIPLSYKPITNFEFILWPAFLAGGKNTEFGSKPYENKLDLWIRFYF